MRKLILYSKLIRFDAPTGYLLSFFPAAFGLLLATPHIIPNIRLLLILFLGSIFVRGAGCIINDILDKNFDKEVERTKNRVLVSGVVSLKEATAILIILLIVSMIILLALPRTSVYIGCLAMVMICIYPLTKRFTHFAQVILGFAFNLGALIGYSAITNQITFPAMVLYISTVFWTMGYDTIYGFMDIKDDKRLSLKSLAVLIENKKYKFWLLAFYNIFIILFLIANHLGGVKDFTYMYHLSYIFIAIFLLYWQIFSLDINSSQNCLTRFQSNNYVGLILLVFLLHH